MRFIPVLLLVSLFTSACSKSDSADTGDAATNNYSSGNPITAPVDYLGAVSKGQQKAIGTIDIASISSAINLYYGAEGSYPTNFQELVDNGYMSKVPAPPRGKKFNYDAKTGTVTLEAATQ